MKCNYLYLLVHHLTVITFPNAHANNKIIKGSITSLTPSIQTFINSWKVRIFCINNIITATNVARHVLHIRADIASALPNMF